MKEDGSGTTWRALLRTWSDVLLPIGGLVLVVVITGLTQKPLIDETAFHQRAIAQYAEQFPAIDIRSYHSASGPSPYVFWAVWARMVGTSISGLRLLTVLFAAMSILALRRIAIDAESKHATLAIALSFLTPYYLPYSITIYTLIPALFFGLASLMFFLRYAVARSAGHLALFVVAGSLAVTARQDYVSYIVAAVLVSQSASIVGLQTLRQRVAVSLIIGIPCLVLGLLFLCWGGTTPPPFAAANGTRGLNVKQFGFFFVFLGFWYWPIVVDLARSIRKIDGAVAFAVATCVALGPLYVTDVSAGGSGAIEGVIAHLYYFVRAHHVPDTLLTASQAGLGAVGAVVFMALARKVVTKPWDYAVVFAIIPMLHCLILLVIPYVWERYYLPIVPVVWLALQDRIRSPVFCALWALCQSLFVGYYMLYKM